jgi:hypothetical protein
VIDEPQPFERDQRDDDRVELARLLEARRDVAPEFREREVGA